MLHSEACAIYENYASQRHCKLFSFFVTTAYHHHSDESISFHWYDFSAVSHSTLFIPSIAVPFSHHRFKAGQQIILGINQFKLYIFHTCQLKHRVLFVVHARFFERHASNWAEIWTKYIVFPPNHENAFDIKYVIDFQSTDTLFNYWIFLTTCNVQISDNVWEIIQGMRLYKHSIGNFDSQLCVILVLFLAIGGALKLPRSRTIYTFSSDIIFRLHHSILIHFIYFLDFHF